MSAQNKNSPNKNQTLKQTGCLLIHGFTGSPNEVKELGAFLEENGVRVAMPVLPGHATHSGDLFNYQWRDWFDCVKAAHADLQTKCDEVFVCGLSMGGTLALHLAAHREVAGVIALAAPVEFPGWKIVGARWLKHFVKYRHKKGGEDVARPEAKEKLASYRRYPYFAVEQLFSLISHVRADLPEVVQPLLLMHSAQDHTVDFSNMKLIFDEVSSVDKRQIELDLSYHVITVDSEQELVRTEVFDFIRHHSKHLEIPRHRPATDKKPA